jgi:3-oxoisoapionate decarboxylase
MNRRDFLAVSAAVPLAAAASFDSSASSLHMTSSSSSAKLGIDLFSLRSQNWSAFQYLDYCAQRKVQVVHFSEVRFIGNLQPEHLREVRHHAESLGIEVEIGTRSVCPTSKMFDPKEGTADEQLSKMLDSAHVVGSKIVRCVLGSADDRKPGPIEAHVEDMVRVLRAARAKTQDLGLKIAVENHAGDMQARELRMLVEEAGPDFVGVCLDSGVEASGFRASCVTYPPS